MEKYDDGNCENRNASVGIKFKMVHYIDITVIKKYEV